MPWRLIVMIVVFAVFLVFITLNLDNKHNISFGFTEIEDVPIFVTIFISFAMGLLFSIPLIFMVLRSRRKKHRRENKRANNDADARETQEQEAVLEPAPLENNYHVKPVTDEKIKSDAAEARKRFFSKRRKK